MAHILTRDDSLVVASRVKEINVKLEIIDTEGKTLDMIEGFLTSGSMTIDASSSSRRTASLVLLVNEGINHILNKKTFVIGENSNIWFNRFIKIHIGFQIPRRSNTIWYPLGKFIFNENSYQYDETTSTLTLNMVDLMETLTGTLGGQIGGADQTIIKADKTTTIRDAMIATVSQLGNIKDYMISDIGSYSPSGTPNDTLIPYDLEFSMGTNVYAIISELRDLYSGYETFFNADGTFICQQVPTAIGDPVVLNHKFFAQNGLVISESLSNNFSSIKNVTEVWGKNIESDRYTEKCELTLTKEFTGYTVKIDNCDALDNGVIIAIKIDQDSPTACKVNILGINKETNAETPLYTGIIHDFNNEHLLACRLKKGTTYCFRLKDQKFVLLGEQQIHGASMLLSKMPTAQEKEAYYKRFNCKNMSFIVNPDSQFCADKIGVHLQVLSGGDYDNIYADDLALQRAEYENWKSTAFQDSLQLKTMLIPWLDVNQKIEYQSYITNQKEQYIIKNINFNFTDGTMDLSLMKFYPLYPFSQ